MATGGAIGGWKSNSGRFGVTGGGASAGPLACPPGRGPFQLRRDRLYYNYAQLDYSATAVDTIKEMAEKMTNRTPSTRPRPTEPPGLANGKTGIASSIKPLCISNRIGTHPLRRP